MEVLAFRLYLLFIASYFLHITSRLPVLGLIRFDLLLVLATAFCCYRAFGNRVGPPPKHTRLGDVGKSLAIMFGYVLITLPVVKWPGSVLGMGLQTLIKAVVFFYFTALLVTDTSRLKKVAYLFMLCQAFRFLEPLALHFTEGYWGDKTYIGEGEFADRLSGAPNDVINPNELAFVVLTGFVFIYYLGFSSKSVLMRLMWLGIVAAGLITLVLTSSRSGFLALLVLAFLIFLKSKQKILLGVLGTVAVVVGISQMNDVQKDRYLSIYRDDVRGAATSKGRISGLAENFEVFLHYPVFGSGLGTSGEANFNYLGGRGLKTHNLYLETMQELGAVGFIIYLGFLRAIYRELWPPVPLLSARERRRQEREGGPPEPATLPDLVVRTRDATRLWFIMTLLFSFTQYNLSIYTLYLIAGFARVVGSPYFRSEEEPQPEPAPRLRRVRSSPEG